MEQVATYIQANLRMDANCITVPCLAKEFGVCETKLKELFRRQQGLPVHTYVIRQRMELARVLLAEPESMIKSIAFELGYRSVSNFSRDFKQQTGYSPREWKGGRYLQNRE